MSRLLLRTFIFLAPFLVFNSLLSSEENPRMTPIVKAVAEVLPSVVNIGTERIVTDYCSPRTGQDPFDHMFRDFFAEQGEVKTTSLGSGVIIDPSGLVLTNSHVVSRATKISITLESGKHFFAKEIASDDINDIALLKIEGTTDGTSFKPVKFAKPDDLMLGETVIAVGNPFGLGHSISQGVLSAVGRKAVYEGNVIFADIIQTDTAINPGNSGGPLLNLNSEMIGISTAIFKDAQGIGFAVPLERIENVLAKWLIPERFSDLSLGIIPAEKVEKGGARVDFVFDEIIPGSPAEKAGLKKTDTISAINGVKPNSLIDISRHLFKLKEGEILKLTVNSGKTYSLKVEKVKYSDGSEMAKVRLGLGLQILDSQLAKALDYPFEGGLVVSDIPQNLSPDDVKRGDILVRLGGIQIESISDVAKALQGRKYGDDIEGVFISITKKMDKYYVLKRISVLKVK